MSRTIERPLTGAVAVKALPLRDHQPKRDARMTLLKGICFCEKCGGAMTIRTGKGGRYRYYTCSIKARQGETDLSLKRLYDAIESGVADISDPALKDRISGLKSLRDQAQVDAERAQAMLESSGNRAVTPATVLRTLTAVSSGKSAAIGVPSLGLNWRGGKDSYPPFHGFASIGIFSHISSSETTA
ncbi:hypothetical protein Swit_5028 (plasmid) [Rhizorhabdus wittichii RW1]|uniref:Recombinase zinc beta ribbon domain-containing protein n=1 Tax=Rhizorhabdus wittichii (strain DSM 6014 / CCUG 31198 / JCM 15750 / NBRC 105917 / EY 4224 / RW1) TaxID=392499 RepID=A0A9J9HH66_RHIWR|nr:hypothetical protein Swit_5028 [Rhizorhabdus wittichii RW1]